MTQTLDTVSGARAATTVPPLAGPIVAAVGGVDPDSVLRAARMVAPASDAGVTAVSVLTPIPVAMSVSLLRRIRCWQSMRMCIGSTHRRSNSLSW